MIVIGVDVHKQSLTAVAVDETGRLLAERTLGVSEDGLLAWAAALGGDRLWAVEDCRHVTRALERELVAAGERLVRVPPKLTAPERRAGRKRGKSDAIDALAAARAALREPNLDRPRPGEERFRELEAARRASRRPRRRAPPRPAAAALASAPARPDPDGPARRARPGDPARAGQPLARPPRTDRAGADRP